MTNIVVTFLINIMKDFIHDLYKERKKETGMKQEQWIKELEKQRSKLQRDFNALAQANNLKLAPETREGRKEQLDITINHLKNLFFTTDPCPQLNICQEYFVVKSYQGNSSAEMEKHDITINKRKQYHYHNLSILSPLKNKNSNVGKNRYIYNLLTELQKCIPEIQKPIVNDPNSKYLSTQPYVNETIQFYYSYFNEIMDIYLFIIKSQY